MIFLKQKRKTKKIICQGSQSPVLNSKYDSTDQDAGKAIKTHFTVFY
jgi:hypothetical protein